MITLGPDSLCDVCLDTFDRNQRAPCSIECGHVFCLGCLSNLSRANCPLCRSQIDRLTYVKLHVDWDTTENMPSKENTVVKPYHEEAGRLMDAIQEMANTGSNETQIQQLIQGLKAFLSSQPRDQYVELRICHRMIKYIYDYKTQSRTKQQALKAELQSALDATTTAESAVEEYKAQNHSLQADLARAREQHRESLVVIERLSRIMESLSMRPSSTDEGWAPRYRDNLIRSSSPNFIISPLPELPLTDLPEVYASRQFGSPSSSVDKDRDDENNSDTSSRASTPSDVEEHEQHAVSRPDSGQGRRSVLRMAGTPAPGSRRSYHSQASSSPGSSPDGTDALPLQNRLHDLLSDEAPHDIPSRTSPTLTLARPDSEESFSRSRAPSRLDASPTAPGSSRSRAEEPIHRTTSRYTTLPPATSASAQALERMQRQNQARETERSNVRQAQEDRIRSPSRGDPEPQPMGYRMSSTSSSSMRQPMPRSIAQVSPSHVSASIEPTPSRNSSSYAPHSGSIRQTSASSRPTSHYYSASSSIGRTRSSNGSSGRNPHDAHVNA